MNNDAPILDERTNISTYWVVFWMIILICFIGCMSYFVFSHQSLRLDEAQSLWQTSHSFLGILTIIAADVHVPLYHMILHVWQVFLGNNVANARVLSLIIFCFTIPAIYFLGKKILGKKVGLFAAILMAISPFLNWYGNEIRMYTLLTFMTILNQYFFLRIFRATKKDDEYKAWWGYAITAVLGMYTHYFFAFILLTEVFFYFIYRKSFPEKSLRKFILIGLVVIATFAPWLWYVRHINAIGNETPLLVRPTSIDLFNTFSQFFFGFQNDHINTILVSLWPLCILFGFLALRRSSRIYPETIYLIMSAFLPIIIVFTISIFIRPIYVSRYLILSLPALYLLISWILSIYPPFLSRSLKFILVVTMLVTLAIESVSVATPVKENYESAAQYLESHAGVQDVIAVSAPFTIYPVEYYYQGQTTLTTLPIWNQLASGAIPAFDKSKLPQEVAEISRDHNNLWLLLSYDQGYEKDIKDYFDNHYTRLYAATLSPKMNLYEYQLKY